MRLQQRQARETGICPVRRELYSQTFDELIRQITIECAERGLLLLRCVCVCVHVCMCVGASSLGLDDSSHPALLWTTLVIPALVWTTLVAPA